MQLEIMENVVMKVEEVKTEKQIALVKTYYDHVYHTVLSYENGQVKAKVYNYLNEFQDDYNGSVTFQYDGATIERPAVNGIATIEFEAPKGEYLVKTVNDELRNGEVVVYVD